jgi:hypothetical protein
VGLLVWDVGLLLGILMVVCSWPCLVALEGGFVGLGCAGGFVAWYFNGRLFLAVPIVALVGVGFRSVPETLTCDARPKLCSERNGNPKRTTT